MQFSPGLNIAARLKVGRVVIADLGAARLEMARRNAARRGLMNGESRACARCARQISLRNES